MTTSAPLPAAKTGSAIKASTLSARGMSYQRVGNDCERFTLASVALLAHSGRQNHRRDGQRRTYSVSSGICMIVVHWSKSCHANTATSAEGPAVIGAAAPPVGDASGGA